MLGSARQYRHRHNSVPAHGPVPAPIIPTPFGRMSRLAFGAWSLANDVFERVERWLGAPDNRAQWHRGDYERERYALRAEIKQLAANLQNERERFMAERAYNQHTAALAAPPANEYDADAPDDDGAEDEFGDLPASPCTAPAVEGAPNWTPIPMSPDLQIATSASKRGLVVKLQDGLFLVGLVPPQAPEVFGTPALAAGMEAAARRVLLTPSAAAPVVTQSAPATPLPWMGTTELAGCGCDAIFRRGAH